MFTDRVARMPPKEARRHLNRAADALLQITDGEWVKDLYAKDAQGAQVGVNEPAGRGWCVQGLVARLYGHDAAERLVEAHRKSGGSRSLAAANDGAPSRSDLVEYLRAAAARLASPEPCDQCEEPAFQIVADATKDPVEYLRRCKAHMTREGPFPIAKEGLE